MGSEILHMILTIFMITSFQTTHIVIADASLNALESFNSRGLQQLYFMESNGVIKENQIEKVAGEDENEEKKDFILEKFRSLLGLKRISARSHPSPGESTDQYVSPAPSPSPTIEAGAPAPAPATLPVHVHSHHSPPHRYAIPSPHEILKKDKDETRTRKRILLPVLVSVGIAFVTCALGLIWFRKYRKGTMSIYNNRGARGKSKHVNSKYSTSKVSLNPGLDLFYLNSVGMDIERQTSCLKQSPEMVNTPSNRNTSNSPLHDREESEREPTSIEDDNVSSSTREISLVHEDAQSIKYESEESTKEITSVHERVESIKYESGDEESMKYESDGGNSSSADKIIPIDAHSSDDESFHSPCDSHSSTVRLSNASAGSFSETSEIFSPNVSKISVASSPYSSFNPAIPMTASALISTTAASLQSNPPQCPCSPKQNILTDSCSLSGQKDIQQVQTPPMPPTPPAPPPPPPPSSRIRILYSHSFFTTKTASKASCSATLPSSSSPSGFSESSSGSNQTPEQDFPSSPRRPPKPTPTTEGIPPPPPPPFLKGNGNSIKAPPPPPSHFPQLMPFGKDGAPLPKLKPLHWDKVRATPDRSMVWDKLRSSSFELDEKMIESLFGYNLQDSMKNDEAKSKSPSPTKHVLEPKRLQNITILSKALNVTAEQVCSALQQGDGLSLQQIEALVKMVPTKEEEAKLSSYTGDINELGSAERLVKAMLNIPFAFQRIEAMFYRDTFEDEVVHLRKSFSVLEEACKELRSSRLFLKLLEAVLKTGNRMNVGTIRGGARAFKLDALLKLADVKGTDGKTTLLHFVVQEIVRSEGIKVSESIMGKLSQKNKSRTAEEREENYRRMGLDLVSGLSTELCNVKKTASIDLDVLANSVSNLSDGMAKLQHLLHKDCVDDKSRNFVHSMRMFLSHAEKNLKELQENEDGVLLLVKEITEYFHGDVSKDEANPLRIFVIVRDFLSMLDRVCKELRSSKVQSSKNPLAPFR